MAKLAKIENDVVVNVIVGASFPGYIPCDDTVSIGWLHDNGTFTAPPAPEDPAPTNEELRIAINIERDRRVDAGFLFGGVHYQSSADDRENIAGAATASLGAISAGAQVGDYRWHGGPSDFQWIAADNTMHTMDAQTVFALGQAAMAHKQAHIFAARALKDANPIPSDFTADAHWPAAPV